MSYNAIGAAHRCRLVRNALGTPLDGKGSLGMEPVSYAALTPLWTLIPIGRGQRELIIGDRQTGKTTVAVDAILNQTDVLCVYVAVGQKTSTVAEMISGLARTKDMSSVVVVLSGADEASTLQFLAPYTGATMLHRGVHHLPDWARVLLRRDASRYLRNLQLHAGLPSGAQHPDAPLPHAWCCRCLRWVTLLCGAWIAGVFTSLGLMKCLVVPLLRGGIGIATCTSWALLRGPSQLDACSRNRGLLRVDPAGHLPSRGT